MLRAILRESASSHGHELNLLDGSHSHSVTGRGHQHTLDGNPTGSQSHSVSDPGHSHGFAYPPDPGHTHREHDKAGAFQPFTDLRPAAPTIYGVTLPGDGGPDAASVMHEQALECGRGRDARRVRARLAQRGGGGHERGPRERLICVTVQYTVQYRHHVRLCKEYTMALTKAGRFELRLEDEQLARIDEWQRKRGETSRANAVRILIDQGLAAGSTRSVQFSDGEKMLMLMMRDMMKALKLKSGDPDTDFLAKVIYGGHYWAPKWDMQGVFHDHVDDPDDVSYVVDVLDMWDFIESAYEALNAKQKADVKTGVGDWFSGAHFSGFDGNNESNHMSIARFLVEDMGRFSRFKGRDLNSHSPTAHRYRGMIAMFEPMRAKLTGGKLSPQQLIALLSR
ncbi:YfbU family protein [Variovorax sp. LjRoot178]|uniref:YfbU family protein n=1 Tax=Variovorax sp. LjRoot178 TaxID=3342277 RepID=UPI003ED0C0C2